MPGRAAAAHGDGDRADGVLDHPAGEADDDPHAPPRARLCRAVHRLPAVAEHPHGGRPRRSTLQLQREAAGPDPPVAGELREGRPAGAALAARQAERPDVLVSDLSMPRHGGYWLIGQVRALPRERGGATPAAALTGAGPEHRASVLNAGFQYHLEKPLGVHELVETVASLALKA